MTQRSLRIELHVEVDGDELVGSADDGTGAPRDFHGWLGLIGALDALLAEAGPQASAAPSSPPT